VEGGEQKVEPPSLKKQADLIEETNVVLVEAFQEKINALRKEVITS
jgi:hypothetical protein